MYRILIFLAILPIYLICKYVYDKDHIKESDHILAKLFIFGILSCFLTLLLTKVEVSIFPFFGEEVSKLSKFEAFVSIFFGVGIIEEFSKWTMVYLIAYKSSEYDEVYDGIVYAVFVSLGFAAFENILYVLGSQSSIVVAGTRALTAVPAHACFAIVMGSFLSLAKLSNKENKQGKEILFLVLSILVPALIHAFYDYVLMVGNYLWLLAGFVFIIVLYICCVRKIKMESNLNRNI